MSLEFGPANFADLECSSHHLGQWKIIMTAFDWLAIIIGPIGGTSVGSHIIIIISLTFQFCYYVDNWGWGNNWTLFVGRGPNWGCEWTCSSQSKSKEHP